MLCPDVVVASRCVSSTDVFVWDSSWSCTDTSCVLLDFMYMIAFYPCPCSLYFGEVFCLVFGGCGTVSVKPEHFCFNTDSLHSCINP
jgi:hypothetical protein